MALCAAAWEQGIVPRGTCIADNNPAFIEAIIGYRAGVHDKLERKMDSGKDDDLPEDVEVERRRIQAAGRTAARPTGRRRKRRPRRGE